MKVFDKGKKPIITLGSQIRYTSLVATRRAAWIFVLQVLLVFILSFAFGFLARNLF